MSLTLAMNNALSGLQVNQSALQVISNNIANVNTPGYSRKVLAQQTRTLANAGVGVEVAGINRQINQFLQRDLVANTTAVGYANVTADYLNRTQTLFGSVGNNNALGNSITSLATAFEDMAVSPEISAHQFSAVNQAVSVAQRFNQMEDTVEAMRLQADIEINSAVTTINQQLEIIAEINSKMPQTLALNQPTGDLEDARDTALETIADYMDVQHFINNEGEMTVLTGGGSQLVSGPNSGTLEHSQSTLITATQVYPANLSGIHLNAGGTPTPANDVYDQINSGRLAGLLEMRDVTLPAITAQIDQLAGATRDEINRVHNRGANTPFGLGTAGADPATMSGTRAFTNTGDPLTLGDDVTMVILDVDGNIVGAPGTISAGATSPDGVRNDIDTFLGALGSATWTADNEMEIKLAPGNRLAFLDNGPTTQAGDSQIDFDADGDATADTFYGLSNFFGLNNLYETPQLGGGVGAMELQGTQTGISKTIRVRDDLITNPEYISRGRVSGTTPNFVLGAGNNEVAQELANAFGENFAFASIANGPPGVTTSLSGYAGTILSYNSAITSAAASEQEYRTFLHQDIETRVLSESGVNIDEELSNMVVFQNAYQASARIVQTANEMFDTLLNLGN
ncbi:flagellar hook-associated protein FlgK [Pelagibius sp. Alg239-R121]|uniref:flagellar hook-associated protein FlgK n=1 Tax=Pelagibius sp. Alg239-R121 TaxID=2993448 RepID=UPI0024A69908|nr:flagellar hook-associated protein FlgK [Pelagibius sp. Alg239-R121]